jgi:hypothetical protein
MLGMRILSIRQSAITPLKRIQRKGYEDITMNSIKVATVFFTDGTIDVDTMREDFETQLGTLALDNEDDVGRIGKAVHAVFDAHPTATLNSAAVVCGAMRFLGTDVLEASHTEKRVKAWLAANTDADGSDTGKAFYSKRGRGNSGYCRRSQPGQLVTMVPPSASESTDCAAE